MRAELLRRLKALEQRSATGAADQLPRLPQWLLKGWEAQGVPMNEFGQPDLAALKRNRSEQRPAADSVPAGTAPDLLLTNNHVIRSHEEAELCRFQFNYQLDRTGRELPMQTSLTKKGGLYHTSPIAPKNANRIELDYTVVQLLEPPDGIAPLRLQGTQISNFMSLFSDILRISDRGETPEN